MARRRGAGVSQRLAAVRRVFTATREADPKLLPLMIGGGLAGVALATILGLLAGELVLGIAAGLLLGLLVALTFLGRRATRVQLAAIEGRPGAAAAVLQAMRGRWRVTPAVAATRKQDLVHRVVGRPGVVLVGEGSPARVRSLLVQEARRVSRVAGDAPVHEISVGEGEGQVPLGRLPARLTKLPRKLKTKQVAALDARLSALGSQQLPIPKGPLPRGVRPPRRRG